jgi:hypothetical protein
MQGQQYALLVTILVLTVRELPITPVQLVLPQGR